ncbi:hypothetical protein, partial [Citrobacter freundii]|uniref:hypothetical protein n=1 Tax=Citrobacter freundii TaxID=546 RepID=UPI001A95623F
SQERLFLQFAVTINANNYAQICQTMKIMYNHQLINFMYPEKFSTIRLSFAETFPLSRGICWGEG